MRTHCSVVFWPLVAYCLFVSTTASSAEDASQEAVNKRVLQYFQSPHAWANDFINEREAFETARILWELIEYEATPAQMDVALLKSLDASELQGMRDVVFDKAMFRSDIDDKMTKWIRNHWRELLATRSLEIDATACYLIRHGEQQDVALLRTIAGSPTAKPHVRNLILNSAGFLMQRLSEKPR